MASQYSDPYEEWKAGGKQGGSYDEWSKSQNTPAPAPTQTPSTADLTKTTQQLTQGTQPAYNSSQNNNYQNYQNYQPPQQNYQTYSNPTGQAQSAKPNAAQASPYGDLSGFKDYNAWRAASGQDSSQIKSWFANQGNPAASYGGQSDGRGGTTPYTGPADTSRWNTHVPMTDTTDHPDALQPSGDPFVDMIRGGAHGSEDFKRFSNAQILAWQSSYDADASAKAGKPMFRNARGVLMEKPTEDEPGYGGTPGGGGGGQGGGYGGGAGGVGQGGEGGGDLALYQVKKQYADALADPTGQKAWELYAGAGGAKTFQAEMDRYRQQIAGMPQGPAREAAEQKMREVESSMRLDMPAQARQQAISGLSGIIQPELGYVGSERDRALNKLLGEGNLSNQRYGMNLNYNLGSRGLDLQGQNQMWNQNTYFPWQAGNAAANMAYGQNMQNQQYQQQNAQNAGATTGQMLQQGVEYFMSDIRMKENIVPGRRGLSDLLKLGSYSYNYKGKPERTQSIMAQDVEKVAPEFVKEFDGIKMVDSQGLLGMTMKAVQDLAKKMEKK
jgi:hypothetical protein